MEREGTSADPQEPASEGAAAAGQGQKVGSEDPVAGLGRILALTLHHFFPKWKEWVRRMGDGRDPRLITYPAEFLFIQLVLMFLLKLGSRRQVRYQMNTQDMLHNINRIAGTEMERLADPDTLNHFLKKMGPGGLEEVVQKCVRRLLRMRALECWRLMGRYLLAVDGTGYAWYPKRHCDHCLTQTRDGKTYYYHLKLDVKLITAAGLVLPVMTEYVENPGPTEQKQDCELKALYRVLPRLKEALPQLAICLLIDGLAMGEPAIQWVKDLEWDWIITFKEGSMPERWREFETLRDMQPENRKQVELREGVRQKYAWVEELPLGEKGLKTNVVECVETKPNEGSARWAWATSLPVRADTVVQIGNEGGRLRWKIENEGFNEEKNGGYELEHNWSEGHERLKKYHRILDVAQILEQLMRFGNLLRNEIGGAVKKVLGGVRKWVEYLKESLRRVVIDAEALDPAVAARMQIRLGAAKARPQAVADTG